MHIAKRELEEVAFTGLEAGSANRPRLGRPLNSRLLECFDLGSNLDEFFVGFEDGIDLEEGLNAGKAIFLLDGRFPFVDLEGFDFPFGKVYLTVVKEFFEGGDAGAREADLPVLVRDLLGVISRRRRWTTGREG
jgi:hypothetical protein